RRPGARRSRAAAARRARTTRRVDPVARPGDRRAALAGKRRRRWRRGPLAARAPPAMGPQLPRATLARAVRVLRDPGDRVRRVGLRPARDGRAGITLGARERNAARGDATPRRAALASGGERPSRHAALSLSRRRAERSQRSALRSARADWTVSRAGRRAHARDAQ